MEHRKHQLTRAVFLWMFLSSCRCATGDESCKVNSTNTLTMCSNGMYHDKEVFLDTNIFLDTSHFCFCTVSFSGALDLKPTYMDDSNCGTLLSVQNAVGNTLKQFTCKIADQITVTGSTLHLKMVGIGTLGSCLHLKSEEDFTTTCYITGYIPPELTTHPQPTVTTVTTAATATTVTSQTRITGTSEQNTSLSNEVNITGNDVTLTDVKTSPSSPLTTGSFDETFILILTACSLGFLALFAVLVLIVCKCVRHMRRTRQQEREDSSYDITMSSNVQKIAARRLIDLDDEMVSADNPVYVKHKNGVLPNDRTPEPVVRRTRSRVGRGLTNTPLSSTSVLPSTEPSPTTPEADVRRTRSSMGRGLTNTPLSSTSVLPSTEPSPTTTEAEVRRTRSRVGRGITLPPILPTSTPLSDPDPDSNGLVYADLDHSEFILSAKDVVKFEPVEYSAVQVPSP